MYLEYVPTLYSPLVKHLFVIFSSFSFNKSLRKLKWSAGVFLKVVTEPINLFGASSSVFIETVWLVLESIMVKFTEVTLPLVMESDLHLEGLNVRPIDSAFFCTSF